MADPQHTRSIDYDELSSLLDKDSTNAVLIDVRTAEQFAEGHIKGARNLAFAQFEEALKLPKAEFQAKYGFELPGANSPTNDMILYCGGGTRCMKSAFLAETAGYKENVKVYRGGYREYKQKIQH